jgi:phage-related baseplate assembly protein
VGDLERHFSAYMVTASFEENKESQVHTSVNVVTSEDSQNPEDRSPQNQTSTINTGKDNGRKGRLRKIKEQAIITNLEKKGMKKIILPTPKMDVKITEQQASRLIT